MNNKVCMGKSNHLLLKFSKLQLMVFNGGDLLIADLILQSSLDLQLGKSIHKSFSYNHGL